MRPTRFLMPLLLLVPASAPAQEGDHLMQSVRQMYEYGKMNVLATAEQTPEEDLAFRPTEEVRSLGQVLGHVADAHFLLCSIGLGEENPNTGSIEQAGHPRDTLIAHLRRSYEYCDRAYQQDGEALSGAVEVFGQPMTRFGAINLNVVHDWEHYGNLVTYTRMRGRVPPSSQPQ